MIKNYTDEKNAQIILALLKEHGIRKVIASPGTTNMSLVASMQNDPYFEMYSSVDERSAAYIACGLAAESGEPVVISCTGATASRNYLSGLTEAFYRKLPVLAITSSQVLSRVGHHVAQVIDRSSIQNDVAKLSLTLPIVKDAEDFWDCEIKVNQAILELTRHGGGPVHLNLQTSYSTTYDVKELPKCRVINRVVDSNWPSLPKSKVAVFIGSHKTWTNRQTEALDNFCSSNNAVVFCDHTSGYMGKYRLLFSLAASQKLIDKPMFKPDILIHIGEVSGDYANSSIGGKQVWRVNEDGEIRDRFQKLRYIFEMTEQNFFEYYTKNTKNQKGDSYLQFCKAYLEKLYSEIPDLPFSNISCASKMAHQIPNGSTIHFAILNSLRAWNLFQLPPSVISASNVGGFGIDGCVSSLIGASFANKNKLYFGVIGDLAFFYDLNVMGNRHVGNNLRILLVNNGKGTEFRQFNHLASHFGDDTDEYISAARHFGNKSEKLAKHFAEDLGYEYLRASNHKEFENVYKRFLIPEITDRPMIFEVFTNNEDESEALKAIINIDENLKGFVKDTVKQVLGSKSLSALRKAIKK